MRRVELGVAREEANPLLGLERALADVDAAERDAAGGGREDAREHSERGCLARPVGAEQAKDLAGVNSEAEPVHGGDAREMLDETLGDEDWRRGEIVAHAGLANRAGGHSIPGIKTSI